MTYEQFQQRWEEEAERERRKYDSRTVPDLLKDIGRERFGEYYQIWYSLGARASLDEAGSLLADFLESDAEYLQRYHCAAALIAIGNPATEGYRPEELSARGAYPAHERLAALRQLLQI